MEKIFVYNSESGKVTGTQVREPQGDETPFRLINDLQLSDDWTKKRYFRCHGGKHTIVTFTDSKENVIVCGFGFGDDIESFKDTARSYGYNVVNERLNESDAPANIVTQDGKIDTLEKASDAVPGFKRKDGTEITINDGTHYWNLKWVGDHNGHAEEINERLHPVAYMNDSAKMRNKIVEYIGDKGKSMCGVDDINEFMGNMSKDESIGKSPAEGYLKRNKQIFELVSRGGKDSVRLTGIGKKIYEKYKVVEYKKQLSELGSVIEQLNTDWVYKGKLKECRTGYIVEFDKDIPEDVLNEYCRDIEENYPGIPSKPKPNTRVGGIAFNPPMFNGQDAPPGVGDMPAGAGGPGAGDSGSAGPVGEKKKDGLAQKFFDWFKKNFKVSDTLAEYTDEYGAGSDYWAEQADKEMGKYIDRYVRENKIDEEALMKDLDDSEIDIEVGFFIHDQCELDDVNEDGTGEYGVRYRYVNKKLEIQNKEKFFKTADARQKFLDKLENDGNLESITSWANPKSDDHVNEDNNENKESGLMVFGKTQIDNNRIGDAIAKSDFHAEWNHEGFWFFKEEESAYDYLESALEKIFAENEINARFEGIFNEKKLIRKPGPTQDDKLKKIVAERNFIKDLVAERFKSAEGVGVDTEFKEISLMVDDSEFQSKQKNWTTDFVNFKFETWDKSMLELKFSYTINKPLPIDEGEDSDYGVPIKTTRDSGVDSTFYPKGIISMSYGGKTIDVKKVRDGYKIIGGNHQFAIKHRDSSGYFMVDIKREMLYPTVKDDGSHRPEGLDFKGVDESNDKTYCTEISHFNLTGEYHPLKDGKERYDGSFTIKLMMGKLKWDIKPDWVKSMKPAFANYTDEIVFAGFAHNEITFQYIYKKDIPDIWDIAVKEFKKYLD